MPTAAKGEMGRSRQFGASMKKILAVALASLVSAFLVSAAAADPVEQTKAPWKDAFRQLEGEEWPTPGTGVFQAMFSVWDQRVGMSFSEEVPSPRGPRNCGQFSPDEKGASEAKIKRNDDRQIPRISEG